MEKTIAIRIASPCHEDWSKMTTAEHGRFCNACSKVVVDFSTMTNNDIITYFHRTKSTETCGRFMSYQLNKPLEKFEILYNAKSKWAGLKKLAALVITGCTILLSSCNRRSDVKGKVIGETMALDSQYSNSHTTNDTVPAKMKDTSKNKNHAKMGKTKITNETLQDEVEVLNHEMIQGGAMPYFPEDIHSDTLQIIQ